MKIKLIILALLFNVAAIKAQQVIANSGDYFKNTSVSLSWTLGESFIETYTSSNVILTQGVHQGNFWVTEIQNLKANLVLVNVYPNPMEYNINLVVTQELLKESKVFIYDINGKLLSEQILVDINTIIPFDKRNAGTYILKVFQGKNEIKTLKIQKK